MNADQNGLPTRASVNEAAASLEMEGFHVDREAMRWCEQVLQNKMTKEEQDIIIELIHRCFE